MKNLTTLLFLCIFLVAVGCKKDDTSSTPEDTKLEEIQTIVDTYNNDFKAQMQDESAAVGIGLYVIDKEIEFYISSGFPEAYGENIHFRIASNSKTFTAAAILRLYQEGKLDIDDVITDLIPNTDRPYIPDTENFNVPYKSQITIRELLQHRAGVFDVTNGPIPESAEAPYAGQYYVDYVKDLFGEDHTFTFEELISVVAHNQLSDFEPGAEFHYSNTGYNVLGYIVENISGKRLHEYLKDEFFDPLQLENTTSPHLGTDQQMPSPYTLSYVKINNEIIEVDKDNLTANISEGQIISTPKSLAKWGRLLLSTNEVLNAEIRAMMIDALPADESHGFYGLGIQVYPTELGYGHDGAHLAYLTTMRYEPESDRTFVIFTNHLNIDNFVNEANALYDVLRETITVLDN